MNMLHLRKHFLKAKIKKQLWNFFGLGNVRKRRMGTAVSEDEERQQGTKELRTMSLSLCLQVTEAPLMHT